MNSTVTKLVFAFVTLLLGVVLITSVSTEGNSKTTTKTIANETISLLNSKNGDINTSNTYTLTNAPRGWKTNDCPLTSVVVTNATEYAMTETTDYTLSASAGTIVFKNTTQTVTTLPENYTLVDYVYCGDDYMNLTWGRTAIKLVPGFFALALLLISVGLFYSIGKENGII